METNPTTAAATASTGPKAVRVVARVRSASADLAIESSSSTKRLVSVHKHESESVSISFDDQTFSSKDHCKLDYCYEENETTGSIFAKEIKPLVISVFEGKDANVIALGARFSGKTHLIQGSEKEHGVAVLTMAEMLSMVEERGNSIYVSVYEVSQETVFDVLDREKRAVSVLEGAQGKIQLKGLSQVHVKTLTEFQNLYSGLKKTQKLTNDRAPRSHKGVMIHVINDDNKGSSSSIGRMNFLDMAGYEDSRKQNKDIAPLEIIKINKSVYALHNVMYALNANESHVPYRESKLTHLLKDCLQVHNKTLLITCLHLEFSQDSVYVLNLASRIWQGSNRVVTNLVKKKMNTPARSISSSSVVQRRHSPMTVSASSRKQTGLVRSVVTERKTTVNTSSSVIKGRKLFGEANGLVNSKINSRKIKCESKMTSKKNITTSKVVLSVKDEKLITEEVCSSSIVSDSQSSFVEEKGTDLGFSSSGIATESNYTSNASLVSNVVNTIKKETPRKHEEMVLKPTCSDDGIVLKDETEKLTEKDIENNSLIANQTESSPPLSIRLQELSNTLKSICKGSNPSESYHHATSLTMLQEERASIKQDDNEAVVHTELRTPAKIVPSSNIGSSSPWTTYSAQSSRLKNSAVSEYLKFLNTAEKEDLKKLKGIGEKRATYIVELREESPEPFKTLDDLKDIGLSAKQIKGLVRKEIEDVFN
ncbi:unnamed protein product [Cochlearia groenlandica]